MPMRQLRRCDFCGGDAAGVYEVLPPELSPTEAEQRRLVLCSDCAGTLETVVDPLLERLGVETDGDDAPEGAAEEPSPGPGASTPPTREPTRAETPHTDDDPADRPVATEVSGEDEPGRRSGAAGGTEPSPTDSGLDAGPTHQDDPGLVDRGADGPEERSPDPLSDGEAGGDLPDGAERAGAETEPTLGDPGEADGAGERAGADDADDASDADDAGARAVASGDEPEEFRTVMRLLGNREFPVERGAIVEVATNAYGLDDRHVHGILDYAVDRGVIADDGGTLRRD